MKPLTHPAAGDVTVEGILHALSDPVRVELFSRIACAQAPQTCSGTAGDCGANIPKSTLSQHFKVLRDAGLVRSERKGVEMLNSSRMDEVEKRFPGLLPAILSAHRAQVRGAAAKAKRR